MSGLGQGQRQIARISRCARPKETGDMCQNDLRRPLGGASYINFARYVSSDWSRNLASCGYCQNSVVMIIKNKTKNRTKERKKDRERERGKQVALLCVLRPERP